MSNSGAPNHSFDLDAFEPPERPARRRSHFVRLAGVGVAFALALVAIYYAWSLVPAGPAAALPPEGGTLVIPTRTPTPSRTASFTQIPAAIPTTLAPPEPTAPRVTRTPLNPITLADIAILALDDGPYSHLFAFDPQTGRFTRLTDGAWLDITPAVSPDATRLAFASNRDGHWDLYVLALESGEITRLTDTAEYDASPSWSPDGLWLAYESYISKGKQGGDLEVFIRPVDGSQDAIRLTDDPAADHSPAWSSQGRRVAFVSTRTGDAEVWLADLDQVDDRYQNLSRSSSSAEAHPAWSPDGRRLVWASVGADGIHSLRIWDAQQASLRPQSLDSGDWPVFSPDGASILTGV
jgi:TolB protein